MLQPPLATNKYSVDELSTQPAVGDRPVLLPLTALLVVPAAIPAQQPFNLPSTIDLWLGSYGWESMQDVMRLKVWAPGWNDDQLRDFARPWLARGGDLDKLRALSFPLPPPRRGTGTKTPAPRYDIVHFVGKVSAEPSLSLEVGRAMLPATALAEALQATRTRLLILQVDAATAAAGELGRIVCMEGGPPVLSVAGRTPDATSTYLLHLYGRLLHNLPLPEAANPDLSVPQTGVEVDLTVGEGAAYLLRFDGAINQVIGRLDRAGRKLERQTAAMTLLRERAARRLHPLQRRALNPQMDSYAAALNDVSTEVAAHRQTLAQVLASPWHHEYEGVIPFTYVARAAPRIEASVGNARVFYEQLLETTKKEEARAPRVLNANFAVPGGAVLQARDGLLAGTEYDLLVDIGPRWTRIVSLVDKGGDFPENALPPGKDGYVIDVVLVSEDFVPHLLSASLWVPRGSGRSFPMQDGHQGPSSGPVALRFRAPRSPKESEQGVLTASARLCLYYENNLLQSAVVKAGVVRGSTDRLKEPNVITVDFVLTDSFVDVEPRFARRAVKLTPDDKVAGHPVKLSLVLNDDGERHRIIVRRRLDGPPMPAQPCSAEAWTPYDPLAALDFLNGARNRLVECSYARDVTGNVRRQAGEPVIGLDRENGKPRQQFAWDLLQMAELGSRLFNRAFGQVKPAGSNCNPAEWRRALRSIVRDASIIQVARSLPTQYVFPWALVYDYPLIAPERSKWKTCQVVEKEWSADGRRQGTIVSRCPFDDKDWHKENIICPYGFWGLRHIIEEPPSVKVPLASAWNGLVRGKSLNVAVARTTDPKLRAGIDAHLKRVGGIAGVEFRPAAEASDWDSVITMLQAPEIAYFLCHGEYDTSAQTSYLRIGASNRISPDDFLDWARLEPPRGPDIQAWKRCHPFIFINGCHTSALKPGEIVSFVGCFSDLEASGVLGTEVSVLLPVAAEVAEFMFTSMARPDGPSVGEALRAVRWQLANKGNLLGLAYTLYGLADLHVVMDGQPGMN